MLNNPVAIVFYDPQGTFTIPPTEVKPVCPGLCSVTFEQQYITQLYVDGHETKVTEEAYRSLVPETPQFAFYDARPSCPYLTALSRLPYLPQGYSEGLAARWDIEATRAAGQPRHLGTPGVRQEFTVTYVSTYGPHVSEYGESWCHTFLQNNDKLIWWTGAQLDIIPGETRTIKATVKKHDYDKGVPVTQLSRCAPLKGERKLTLAVDTQVDE